MAQTIKVYYDREGDFLEVLFSGEPGFMRKTNHDDVMERVGEDGKILSTGSLPQHNRRSFPPTSGFITLSE